MFKHSIGERRAMAFLGRMSALGLEWEDMKRLYSSWVYLSYFPRKWTRKKNGTNG
jgi:hypothetical protein